MQLFRRRNEEEHKEGDEQMADEGNVPQEDANVDEAEAVEQVQNDEPAAPVEEAVEEVQDDEGMAQQDEAVSNSPSVQLACEAIDARVASLLVAADDFDEAGEWQRAISLRVIANNITVQANKARRIAEKE